MIKCVYSRSKNDITFYNIVIAIRELVDFQNAIDVQHVMHQYLISQSSLPNQTYYVASLASTRINFACEGFLHLTDTHTIYQQRTS